MKAKSVILLRQRSSEGRVFGQLYIPVYSCLLQSLTGRYWSRPAGASSPPPQVDEHEVGKYCHKHSRRDIPARLPHSQGLQDMLADTRTVALHISMATEVNFTLSMLPPPPVLSPEPFTWPKYYLIR